MSKYCPKCFTKLDDNDMCFHYKKPHPRSNRAYHCPNCNEVSCWIKLITDKNHIEIGNK